MDKPLRVSRLVEQDFMRINALDVTPGRKSLVLLKGNNDQGKTSALRALISALSGKRADPDEPIRTGRDGASVDITLADELADRLRISVKWTPNGRYLTVRQLDEHGAETKLPAGQTVLDGLIGALAYNPLEFMQAHPDARIKMLMQAIGQEAQFNKLMLDRANAYNERTNVNRRVKELEQRVRDTPDPAPDEELQETSVEDLRRKLQAAEERNAEIDAYYNKLQAYTLETRQMEERRAQLRQELEQLESDIAMRREKIVQGQAKYAELARQKVNTDDTVQMLNNALERNGLVHQQHTARKALAALKDARHDAALLTKAIESTTNRMCEIVRASDIAQRVNGLAVTEDARILYNSHPIEQASGMQQLELSCLVGMAANPQLRVMCIDEGDKLDAEALDRLKSLAREHNYQIWMTAIYAGQGDPLEHIVHISDGNGNTSKTPAVARPPEPDPPPQVETAPTQRAAGTAAASNPIVDLSDIEL